MANFRNPWAGNAPVLPAWPKFHAPSSCSLQNAWLLSCGPLGALHEWNARSNISLPPLMTLVKSGPQWVHQFPTSTSVTELTPAFGKKVTSFIASIKAGGGQVNVAATYRPPERAYLMHYAWAIAHGAHPSTIPSKVGVPIDWIHLDAAGRPDLKAARAAAAAMVTGYHMRFTAVLKSRHTERRAIDMTITQYEDKDFVSHDGTSKRVRNETDLYALGATYGVIKLVKDKPHWSDDGH